MKMVFTLEPLFYTPLRKTRHIHFQLLHKLQPNIVFCWYAASTGSVDSFL